MLHKRPDTYRVMPFLQACTKSLISFWPRIKGSFIMVLKNCSSCTLRYSISLGSLLVFFQKCVLGKSGMSNFLNPKAYLPFGEPPMVLLQLLKSKATDVDLILDHVLEPEVVDDDLVDFLIVGDSQDKLLIDIHHYYNRGRGNVRT